MADPHAEHFSRSCSPGWVGMKLRSRQANPQEVWQRNDLNDVTERSWSSMLAAAKVPEHFGMTLPSAYRRRPTASPSDRSVLLCRGVDGCTLTPVGQDVIA